MAKSLPASDLHTLSVLEEIYQTRPPVESGVAAWIPKVRPPIPWQRVASLLAVVLGFFGVAVCLGQLVSNIRYPTSRLAKLPLPSLRDLQAQAGAGFSAVTADADGDGLLNVQEQQLGTSAYLEDTDSDGMTDRDEVAAGSDPLCPAGQNCGTPKAAAAQTSPVPAAGNPPLTPTVPSVGAALNAAQLREQMLKSGMSPELLQGFTDQQLLEVYQQVQREEAGNLSGAAPPGAPVSGFAPGGTGGIPSGQLSLPAGFDPRSITPAQMRNQLLSQGVPADVLNQVTDAQLQQIMNEALQEIQSGQ